MSLPAVTELADPEVVARVRAGAHADFEVLVRRHNQRLYRAARGITRDDQEAEDVVQAAWLSIFRHLDGFRGEASFATWATRIVVREALAQTRKRPPIAEVRDQPEQEARGPAAAADRACLGRLLERGLAGIPAGSREVLVLRDVLELDTAETATCLGVSEEAVRVRLHRARAALASAMTIELAGGVHDLYGFDGERCARVTAAVMAAIRA